MKQNKLYRRKVAAVFSCMLLFILFFSACRNPVRDSAGLSEENGTESAPEEKTDPEKKTGEVITMKNVQCNGWRNLIADERYVYSTNGLGIQGTGKIEISTGVVRGVCLDPNCSHDFPYDPRIDPDYCRIPPNSDLYFVVGQELFYRYHVFLVDFEKVARGEENNTSVFYIFASYNVETGESRDLLQIETTENEQMLNFIHNEGWIYYSRWIRKDTDGRTEYRLSLCRMKIGEYREEILFAYEDVCELPEGVVPDPLAVEDGKIYLTCCEIGSILEIDLNNGQTRRLVGGEDGEFGIFDIPGVYYSDGWIYYGAVSPDLAGREEERFVAELWRVNCGTGEKEKLTEDLVSWFFVSDRYLYYEMAFNVQPTERQNEEVGKDYSVHTVKRMKYDGSDVVSVKIKTSSAEGDQIEDVVGAGDSLYFRVMSKNGRTGEDFKLIYHWSTGTVTELGRKNNRKDV